MAKKTATKKTTTRTSWKGDRGLAALKVMVHEKKTVPVTGLPITKLEPFVQKTGGRLSLTAEAKKLTPVELFKAYRARARRA